MYIRKGYTYVYPLHSYLGSRIYCLACIPAGLDPLIERVPHFLDGTNGQLKSLLLEEELDAIGVADATDGHAHVKAGDGDGTRLDAVADVVLDCLQGLHYEVLVDGLDFSSVVGVVGVGVHGITPWFVQDWTVGAFSKCTP
jgi:hypothetical protein